MTLPNATMLKFGHPASVVADTGLWSVQVRPQQPALGSLVLVCKEPATAFGQLTPAAFAELQTVVARVETVLKRFTAYQKINYLMLMMVDPDVHFHVIPRYEGTRDYHGVSFADAGWPGPPALGQAVTLDAEMLTALTADLKAMWVDVT
jgi:diadenosine tetraphosphate (Ap4A) HIT family hydrolase